MKIFKALKNIFWYNCIYSFFHKPKEIIFTDEDIQSGNEFIFKIADKPNDDCGIVFAISEKEMNKKDVIIIDLSDKIITFTISNMTRLAKNVYNFEVRNFEKTVK